MKKLLNWYRHPKCPKSSTGRHSFYVPKNRTDDEHCCRLCGYVTLKSALHRWASDSWAGVEKKITIKDNLVNGRMVSI